MSHALEGRSCARAIGIALVHTVRIAGLSVAEAFLSEEQAELERLADDEVRAAGERAAEVWRELAR